MDCSCIGSDGDNCDFWDFEPTESFPIAKKNWKCQECGRVISKGEKYSGYSGKAEGSWIVHRSCMDCQSVTENLFCSWTFGKVWDALSDYIWDSGGEISWSKVAKLTPVARGKVCDLIEKCWEK